MLTSSGFCQRKVASDGACLFNAVSLAIDGDVTKSYQIRQEIAAIILSDEQKYNRSFLGGMMEPI